MGSASQYISVKGGRVWCRVCGSIRREAVIVLHGGPGYPSYYLESLEGVSSLLPVVFYDQLGCGRSDRITDLSLLTLPRFVEELEAVRAACGIKRLHLFGHSWGAILALEYAARFPRKVRSLVLASPCISMERWRGDTERNLGELSEEHQAAVLQAKETGDFRTASFRGAVAAYNARFVCRLNPRPLSVLQADQSAGSNVYRTMWGPCEFLPLGKLSSYEEEQKLGRLRAPVLFTAGRFDEVSQETLKGYARAVRDSKIEIYEESSHMAAVEEPERHLESLRGFYMDLGY